MRSVWIGIAFATIAVATPVLAFKNLDYAPEDAIRYTLAASLGRGQEGPGASLNLGFHFGHLMVGALALGATEINFWPGEPIDSHAEGALLVGYSYIDRLLFMEAATGLSLSNYVRKGDPIVDTTDCPIGFLDHCGSRYEKREEFPWGIPLELTAGLHSGALGLGFTFGANFNRFAPDNYAMVRVWTGFDRRFSAFDGPKRVLGRILLGRDEEAEEAEEAEAAEDGKAGSTDAASRSTGVPPLGNPLLSGVVTTNQGLGLWLEKRWGTPEVYVSVGGGSSYRSGNVGDSKADWTAFPALQVGHAWGRARILTLSTGVGLFMGHDGDDLPDMFALNVPVQITYLFRFRHFAPGLLGGLMFNEPRAGYFLALVAGF
jgi:hypothetical protein